jgi:RNA polymerase sigma-70 factor (ECF subfamily)
MAEENRNPRHDPDRSPHEVWESFRLAETPPPASDVSLMSRILANDQDAMAVIFDRYGSLVYSIALRILKDPGQAEDVLQEIFIQLWKYPTKFAEGRGSLPGWLAVVARNRAIDHLRQRRPSESFGDVIVASSVNLASEVERDRMIEKVRSVMSALPANQQRMVELAFFEGMTHAEIAARTGEPLGTVKTRIRTALASLRKEIER